MSISTKGIIVTSNKDVFPIVHATKAAITKYMLDKIGNDQNLRRFGFFITVEIPSTNAVIFRFKESVDNDLYRAMWIHFDCDCDCSDIHDGPKLIVSMGVDSIGPEIVKVVTEAIGSLVGGRAWFTPSDAGDNGRWLTNQPQQAGIVFDESCLR